MRPKRVLVTGGAGFIPSNLIRHLLAATEHEVVSLDETRRKRSTGVRRIASSRICVPSTFVVTNSEAPSSIDFSTCDSAAAFTITSTSATTSSTSFASRMSPWTNERRSCASTSARFSRLPA